MSKHFNFSFPSIGLKYKKRKFPAQKINEMSANKTIKIILKRMTYCVIHKYIIISYLDCVITFKIQNNSFGSVKIKNKNIRLSGYNIQTLHFS